MQSLPQVIPAGTLATVPLPVPVLFTVSVAAAKTVVASVAVYTPPFWLVRIAVMVCMPVVCGCHVVAHSVLVIVPP